MPRLTADQWADVRAEREAGASFGDLSEKFGVDKAAVFRRAKKEGWSDGSDVAEVIRRKVNEKVNAIAPHDPARKAASIDAAANRGADVVRRQQADWDAHRAHFGAVPENFDAGKLAKISAEMLAIRHKSERVVWGLDTENTGTTLIIDRSYGRQP